MQPLREEARNCALAYVGICSSTTAPDGKPWGMRILTLVENWDATWLALFTPALREVRSHLPSTGSSLTRDSSCALYLHLRLV